MSRIRVGHNSGEGFIEDEALTPSQSGYAFQFRLTALIIERLQGFSTVTLKDMSGNVVTIDNHRRRGPDGGLDLVIEIEARTETAAKAVATRVRAILAEIR